MTSHIEKISAAMQSAPFYPHKAEAIQREETHISVVFLTGSTVYKLKKPVRFSFLDFSTLKLRRHYCEQEVILNRRLSKEVYQEIAAITLERGRYCLNGTGAVVEYAVQMKQLPPERVMKRLLRNGLISSDDLKNLACKLVEFYQGTATGETIDDMGAVSVIKKNCEENFVQTFEFKGETLDSNIYDAVEQATDDFLKRHSRRFQHRIDQHHIRDGHGDLRTGHIYFAEDQIQIIDCIEFNKRFRYVDVIGDLAFLLMDMDYLGFSEAARTLFKFYLIESKDMQCARLLSFYKCYRAMVRIKVNCLRLGQPNLAQDGRLALMDQTRRYLTLAHRYTDIFSRPSIWVVCGMIATGKSTMADALAQAIDATLYSSDRVRKNMAQRGGPAGFGQGIYTKEFTRLTYDKLSEYALRAIEESQWVVLDATFGDRSHRDALVELAGKHQARLLWIECRCPEAVIRRRLKGRERNSESDSDARTEHFEPIKATYTPPHEIDSEHRICINTVNSTEANLWSVLAQFM